MICIVDAFDHEGRWQAAADRLGMTLNEWIVATLDAASDGDDCGPVRLSSRPMAESCVFDACPLPVTESLHVTYRLEGKAPIDADLAVCANHYDHLTRGTIGALSLTPKAVAAVPRPR